MIKKLINIKIFFFIFSAFFITGCIIPTNVYEALSLPDKMEKNLRERDEKEYRTLKVDSLINESVLNIKEKINTYNTYLKCTEYSKPYVIKYCHHIRVTDSNTMRKFINYLIESSKNIKDQKTLSDVYKEIAKLYNDIDDKINAKIYLTKALNIDKELCSKKITCDYGRIVYDYDNLAKYSVYPEIKIEYAKKALKFLNKNYKNKKHNKTETDGFFKSRSEILEDLYKYSLEAKKYKSAQKYLNMAFKDKLYLSKNKNEIYIINNVYKPYYLKKAKIYSFTNKSMSVRYYEKYFKACKKVLQIEGKNYIAQQCSMKNFYLPCIDNYLVYFDFFKVYKNYDPAKFYVFNVNEYIENHKVPVLPGSKIYKNIKHCGDFYAKLGIYFLNKKQYQSAVTFFDKASLKYMVKLKNLNYKYYYKKAFAELKTHKYKNISAYSDFMEAYKDIMKRKNQMIFAKHSQKQEYLDYLNKSIMGMLVSSYVLSDKSLFLHAVDTELNSKGELFNIDNDIYRAYYEKNLNKNIKKDIKEYFSLKQKLSKLYLLPDSEKKYKEIALTKQKIKGLYNSIYFNLNIKPKHYTNEELSDRLNDDELYIDVFKSGNEYFLIYLCSKEDFISWNYFPPKRAEILNKLILKFRKLVNLSVSSPEDLTLNRDIVVTSSKIYDLLFGFMVDNKDMPIDKYKKLIISPAGYIALIPFNALYDKRHRTFLGSEKEISLVPSAKFVFENVNDTDSNRADIFADPTFNKSPKIAAKTRSLSLNLNESLFRALSKGFPELPGTYKEAKIIDSILKNDDYKYKVYLKEQANSYNLLNVSSPSILHIATHGFYIKNSKILNPMLKSGLVLSGANVNTQSGIVTALRLSGIDLKNTDLVVLSACDTGVLDLNSTDSVSALNKSFLIAGANNVVSTLWEINDEATVNFMKTFYKYYTQTKSALKALRMTQEDMVKQHKPIVYWAPFVLYGVKH